MERSKKKLGRPRSTTPDVLDAICARIAAGESLRKICQTPGIPNIETIRKLLGEDSSEGRAFLGRYARAREEQADYYADLIAEAAMADPERTGEYGGVDSAEVANRRLRVDALKWIACKLKPTVYGDRQTTVLTGANGGPVVIQVVTGVPTGETDAPK